MLKRFYCSHAYRHVLFYVWGISTAGLKISYVKYTKYVECLKLFIVLMLADTCAILLLWLLFVQNQLQLGLPHSR